MTALQSITRAIGEMFIPLRYGLRDRVSLELLLRQMGYDVSLNVPEFDITRIQALFPIDDLETIITETASLVDADNTADRIETILNLSEAIWSAIDTLRNASFDVSQITGLPSPVSEVDFWIEVGEYLPQFIPTYYLRWRYPKTYALFILLGLIVEMPMDDEGNLIQSTLNWSLMSTLLTEPEDYLKESYGWGEAFQASTLFLRLHRLVSAYNLDASIGPINPQVASLYLSDTHVDADFNPLTLYIHRGRLLDSPAWVTVGLGLHPIPGDRDDGPGGLYIAPLLQGDATLAYSLSPDISLELTSEIDAGATAGIELVPGSDPRFVGTSASITQGFRLIFAPDEAYLLVGESEGSRIELDGWEIAFRIEGTTNDPQLIFEAATTGSGLQVIIAPGEGDSFIRELLGENELKIGADVDVEWSSVDGFRIAGGAELDVTFPLNLNLFFLTIFELHLALGVGTDGNIEAQADIDASAVLGPFTLAVSDIGTKVILSPDGDPTARGTFGGFELAMAFKPPDGVGAGFDLAGVAYGGGYLEHDPERGEYSGIVTLEFVQIGITAIAIITTRPPDNPDGWSMFISINVYLGGIPLGFGFLLLRVGGLIGLHRGFDSAALQDGIRTGMLDSIMFPDDPIANAARILTDIETAFPTATGSFVLGAMLQIGWGVPTLITANLGFIVQLPDLVIALLGQVQALLPIEEEPLVEIHFDVVGIIDLTEGSLAIDAGLRDSQIVGFVLTGQLALRMRLLDEPTFLLAMGGFHPAFTPPEAFPVLARLGVSLSVGDWLSIALESYLALTSNTVQFGAGLYLTAKFAAFRVEGGTEINTLIQFSPFKFRSDLSFFISVSAGSVELLGVLLTGHVSGPNPYVVQGQARFKILGLEKEVDIQETIGDTASIDDIDEVDVLAEVAASLRDPASWRAVDEGERTSAVLLAEVDETADALPVHPGGSVAAWQRVAPLDVQLEHFGNAEIEGEDELAISGVQAGGQNVDWTFEDDWFAPAQFFDMKRNEKLSAPSFEKMKSGLRFGGDEADGGGSADTIYNYEQIIHDPEFEVQHLGLKKTYRPALGDLAAFQSQIVTRGQLARPLITRATEPAFSLQPTKYVIATRETLEVDDVAVPAGGTTYAEARQALRQSDLPTVVNRVVVTAAEVKKINE